MTDLDTLIRIRLERMVLGASDIEDHCNAIRAVLKLHTESVGLCDECTGQEDFQVWPCNTVEAIARELGVSDD